MIQIDNLQVWFGRGTPLENHALRGISLEIPQGQFITVIGSNGAGKSTLLNALAGEITVSEGFIRIDGADITHLPPHKRALRVARVFQDPMAGTCENLTIEENLALAIRRGRTRSLRPALRKADIGLFRERLAGLNLGLENRLKDRMGLLSGGQRQAVSLLMATLVPSDVLLLDEHTAALDPKTAAFVIELTRRIVEEQKLTAMMVTHSMRQALDVGDRTLMLHGGQIAFDVSGEERAGLDVPDLLALFSRRQGEALSDDSLLLG